jgi:hypothetical protein
MFLNRAAFICCAVLLVMASNAWVVAQDKEKEFSGEGVVVAYQKKLRCPGCKSSGGTASGIEYWIVRIDEWLDGTGRVEKFIRVEFNIYDRSPTAAEINSARLRFTLREGREDENTDCIGEVVTNWETLETRPAEISDYELTKPGKTESIPPLQSLACFVTYHPPAVVE